MKKRFEENPEARKQRSNKLGKNKPFDVFENDGTFIKTFTYQYEAIEYLQKEYKNTTKTLRIDKVLLGKSKSSGGFVFKYRHL